MNRHCFIFCVSLSLLVNNFIDAAEDPAVIAKQKKAAQERLAQLKLTDTPIIETSHLFVFSNWDKAKSAKIAKVADNSIVIAMKALKIEDPSKLWPGKLAVYILPERRDFNSFIRLVEQRKPDSNESQSIMVRGEEPYILLSAASGTMSSDSQIASDAISGLSALVLSRKAGATTDTFRLPTWLTQAFGQMILHRTDLGKQAGATYRSRMKTLFTKAKLPLFSAGDTWNEEKTGADYDLLRISLMEYLAYGLENDQLEKFLAGYKPNEGNDSPNTGNALEAISLTPETLDAAWKAWVMKQR